MSRVIREAFVRAVSDGQEDNRQIDFVISTEAEDTYGTIFEISGWQLERYNNNPVVLYAHRSNSDDPDVVIGTSVVRIEGSELVATVTFEAADNNPLAEKVYRKVQKGILRMASVGADIREGRWGDFENGENPDVFRFTKMDLLEWSIVAVGSNPDALKRSADELEDIKKRFPKEGTGNEPPRPSGTPPQERNGNGEQGTGTHPQDVNKEYNSVANRSALLDLKIKMSK